MLFHLATRSDWDARSEAAYTPQGWEQEGFIHCSSANQLVPTAHARFAGRPDLLVLEIDEPSLSAPVIWEDLYDAGDDFPHVYGPVELAALTSVRPFPPDANGRFDWWTPGSEVVAHPQVRSSAAVQGLLAHIRERGFGGVPEPRGLGKGLAFVSYLPGETLRLPLPTWLGSGALASLGVLMRQVHDASVGYTTDDEWMIGRRPQASGEVHVHRHVGPESVVWSQGRAIGIIDWDLAEPGDRLTDLGLAAVALCGLAPPERADSVGVDPDSVPDRISALAVGYGDVSPVAIVRAAETALTEDRHFLP